MSRATLGWIILGWVGYALLPWYGLDRTEALSLGDYFVGGSGLAQGLQRAWWLLPILAPLLVALRPTFASSRESGSGWLIVSGLLGLALIVLQGFTIGLNGWTTDALRSVF